MKLIITGIVLVVTALVMVKQFVETDSVQVMKPMIIVQTTVYLQGNVLLAKLLTVTEQTNAGLKAGLVMVFQIVKISSTSAQKIKAAGAPAAGPRTATVKAGPM